MNKSTIKLTDSDGQTHVLDSEKIEIANHYYKDLYGSKETNQQAQTKILKNLPKIPTDLRKRLDQSFTLKEVEEVISQCNGVSAPGPNGITGAFFKHFKHLIAPILLKLFNTIYTHGDMPKSTRQSEIILIFKKGGKMTSKTTAQSPYSTSTTSYSLAFLQTARKQ